MRDPRGFAIKFYTDEGNEPDRDHLVANIVAHAGDHDVTAEMRDRVVAYWAAVALEVGKRGAEGLGRPAGRAVGNGAAGANRV